MNGFITESTSKITDGFGTAVYILVLYFFLYYAAANVESTLGKPGYILLILILLAVGIFMLTRALRAGKAEAQLADAGITAGVLLWQCTAFSNAFGNAGFSGKIGWLYWSMALLVMIVLWRKTLPPGLRFLLLVYLSLWVVVLYHFALPLISGLPTVFTVLYHFVRVAALAGVLVFMWAIVYHTTNSLQRKLCAVGLAFCVFIGAGIY